MSTPSPRPPRRMRRAAAAGLATAVAAAGLATLAPVSVAGEATTTVTFRDCEVRKFPYTTNTRVKDNLTWTTRIRLNHPSPIRTGESVTAEVELVDPLPGDIFPEPVNAAALDVEVWLSNGVVGDLHFVKQDIWLDDFDATQPVKLEEIEDAYTWYDAALYPQRPKRLYLLLTGRDAADEFLEYSFACDEVLNPPSLFTLAVYDPHAPAQVSLDRYAARQGQLIRVTGKHLLSSAPTNPPARASVVIGGITVGTVPIDASGAVDGAVRVPAYARPGTVQVRVANGTKSATTSLVVSAVKGKVIATPKKAKRGKRITLRGSAFKPSESVRVRLAGGTSKGKKAYSVTVRANAGGAFSRTVKLKKAAKGPWKVTATGTSSGRVGRTSLRVR